MSAILLKRRLTSSEDDYRKSLRSDDSLILISPLPEACDPVSADLSVGDRIFESETSTQRGIPEEGITLRPRRAIVVYTNERLCVPHNVFGIVSGKGSLIYHGVFISHGKIDPSFQDNLRVGILNGSNRPIQIKPGMLICSCSFFQMDSHMQDVSRTSAREPVKPPRPTVGQTLRAFWKAYWQWIIGTFIAALTAVARFLGLWGK
jgi:deoxycytidine triphosphate deaminase